MFPNFRVCSLEIDSPDMNDIDTFEMATRRAAGQLLPFLLKSSGWKSYLCKVVDARSIDNTSQIKKILPKNWFSKSFCDKIVCLDLGM